MLTLISTKNTIKHYRKLRNITQQNLADMLGINRYTMSNIETGQVFPTPDQIEEISLILKKPPTVLFDLEQT